MLTLDKYYLFCSQYLFNVINKKIISIQEKEYQKLINKSNDFSSLYTNIKQTTKLSNNPKIFDYENESIDSKEDICKTFAKHFSSVYCRDTKSLESVILNDNQRSQSNALSYSVFDMTHITRQISKLNFKNLRPSEIVLEEWHSVRTSSYSSETV
jgi:hypothetical protein